LITYKWYVLGRRQTHSGLFWRKPEGKWLLGRHVEMEGKKLIFKAENEGSRFDMDTEWDFVNAVMKTLMPQNKWNFLSC
jgi:hypothetical protein